MNTIPDKAPTAAFIIIGNEILSGRTVDKNLNYLAKGLTEAGVRLKECRVIPDVEDVIVSTVRTLSEYYKYVFTSGGIGPTHDDITASAIAKAFNVPIIRNKEAVERLERYYAGTQYTLNEARLKMAEIPEGATLIDNPVSAAPGFIMRNVYVMAGVPSIMQAMFDNIRATLVGGRKMLSHEVAVYLPEGTIAAPLSALQDHYPEIEIGSYPFMRDNRLGTSLVLRGTDGVLLDKVEAELRAVLMALDGEVDG